MWLALISIVSARGALPEGGSFPEQLLGLIKKVVDALPKHKILQQICLVCTWYYYASEMI